MEYLKHKCQHLLAFLFS
ncbi:Hypothetical protein LLA12_01378 [Lactococcus lactis subsp. lactis]|nr:Hypothetical protein LLA12_01378 [Lactococcus lactis subsp. lactis]